MSSFQLDPNGDLEITNNSLTLTSSLEAIRQHLQVRFRLFLGEWFLDISVGVPYCRDILVKKPSFVCGTAGLILRHYRRRVGDHVPV